MARVGVSLLSPCNLKLPIVVAAAVPFSKVQQVLPSSCRPQLMHMASLDEISTEHPLLMWKIGDAAREMLRGHSPYFRDLLLAGEEA